MLEVTVTSTEGDQRPLWAYGHPGRPTISSLWRRDGGCGDFKATVTLDVPTGAAPAGLALGAKFDVRDSGLLVFSGNLVAPQQGRPWTLTAFGPITETYSTRGSDVPNDAVDAAISRGWDIDRVVSLGSGSVAAGSAAVGEVPFITVPELLDAQAEASEQRWGIDSDRDIFLAPDATTPTWVYTPADAVQGVADENFATVIEVYYVSAMAGTPPVPSAWGRAYAPGTPETTYGTREVFVDVTDRGLMSSGEAATLAAEIYASYGAKLHYDQPFTVDTATLRHFATGAPGRPSQVRAGDVVRQVGVFDDSGISISGIVADVLIGEYEYDDATGVGTCTPFDGVDRSLTGAVDKAFTKITARRQRRAGLAA